MTEQSNGDPKEPTGREGIGGRPTKFTPENCKKILNAVAIGAPLMLAPLSAGVAYRTMRQWIAQGEKDPESELS